MTFHQHEGGASRTKDTNISRSDGRDGKRFAFELSRFAIEAAPVCGKSYLTNVTRCGDLPYTMPTRLSYPGGSGNACLRQARSSFLPIIKPLSTEIDTNQVFTTRGTQTGCCAAPREKPILLPYLQATMALMYKTISWGTKLPPALTLLLP